MRLLADENIPLRAVAILKKKGYDIVSLLEFGKGLKDAEVLDLACNEGRTIARRGGSP